MRSIVSLVADVRVPLESLALALAARFDDRLDVAAALATLDELASGLSLEGSPESVARGLRAHLHSRHGFDGERGDYYAPQNGNLAHVLRTRRGLPLTLSLVYVAVARRAGFEVEPIGFPGHFLVRHGGPGGVLQDPYHGGRVIGDADLANLASRYLGHAGRLEAEHLAPIGRPALAVRILANFRNAYAHLHDHARALLACDALVELTQAPEARRDRGLHALALGALAAAQSDLEAYLEECPMADDVEGVHAALRRCRVGVTLN